MDRARAFDELLTSLSFTIEMTACFVWLPLPPLSSTHGRVAFQTVLIDASAIYHAHVGNWSFLYRFLPPPDGLRLLHHFIMGFDVHRDDDESQLTISSTGRFLARLDKTEMSVWEESSWEPYPGPDPEPQVTAWTTTKINPKTSDWTKQATAPGDWKVRFEVKEVKEPKVKTD